MQLGADHVRVRVPATSANLGPGFDSLGLALGLYDEVEVRALASSKTQVETIGEGAGAVPADDRHLVARALRAALEYAGAPQIGLHLRCSNGIPHGRGLGSSGAAVVAGIMAARALVADPSALDDTDVLRLATEFEGHPDNAAPAILGGATIAWEGSEGARAVRTDVDPALAVTVLVPTFRLATAHARGVLPGRVPHVDAARNAGRSALLVRALAGRLDLLGDATEDRLHQDYRERAMPGTLAVVRALRAAGLAAVVSGAGPTILVLSDVADRPAVDRIVDDEVGPLRAWRVRHLEVDHAGCVALPVTEWAAGHGAREEKLAPSDDEPHTR